MLPFLFILNLVTTAIMIGVIRTIQIVHYPFLHRVDKQDFGLHMDVHRKKISNVVIPVMLAELASEIGLVFINTHFQGEFIAGFILVLLIWIYTAVIQVPFHSKLANGYNQTGVQKLVKLNWIRTVLWSVRLPILLFIISHFSFSRL